MIICSILITKQLILCGQCKEILHIGKLAGAERVDPFSFIILYKKCQLYRTSGFHFVFIVLTVKLYFKLRVCLSAKFFL